MIFHDPLAMICHLHCFVFCESFWCLLLLPFLSLPIRSSLHTQCDLRLGGTILVGFTVQGSTLWVSHQDVPGRDGGASEWMWVGYLEKQGQTGWSQLITFCPKLLISHLCIWYHHISSPHRNYDTGNEHMYTYLYICNITYLYNPRSS